MNVVEQFTLFGERVKELCNTRLAKQGLEVEMKISFNHETGTTINSKEPDEDDLRSFLLAFRQFVSEREPVFLPRVYNLGERSVENAELKGYLRLSKEKWKQAHHDAGFRLLFNERELTPEYVADLYINGHYFHNDEGKRAEIQRSDPLELLFIRTQFLKYLVDATRQVLAVDWVIQKALSGNLVADGRAE